MTSQQYQTLRFTGNGGEYFRIWIVNVFLSIITLGIYSAWAKVRRNQYFYRHTQLADAGFDYHGDPKVILKGRIIAFLMFLAYSITSQFDPASALAVLAVIMLIMPWLLVRSLRFRLHNTSYRGLRFSFHGQTGDAYITMLLWPVLSSLTLGFLWPFAHQRMTRYIRDNSAYGNVLFKFAAGAGSFYKLYGMIFVIAIVNFLVAMGITRMLMNGGALSVEADKFNAVSIAVGVAWAYIGLVVIVVPYLAARMQNLLWNNTTLGNHHFSAGARARDLLGIMFTNVLLIVLTLGLYKPFADIRLTRYRLEHIAILPDGDLEQIIAGLQVHATATGEEMADMFDIDIAL